MKTCKVCGNPIEQKQKGRTREYCSDKCKNYIKFFNALEKTIDEIDFKEYEYIKKIRSDLFILTNHLPRQRKAQA